jgi:hypothetical protein
MSCQWVVESTNDRGWRRYVCQRPDCQRLSAFTPDEPSAWAGQPTCRSSSDVASVVAGPCSHLGPEIRREECPTCSGKVQVKVFACGIFGETSLAKPLPGVQVCQGCPRYSSLAPRPAEEQNGEL